MNKFVFLFSGLRVPESEAGAAWMAWFSTIGDQLVDNGNPFGAAVRVTGTTSAAIENALLGYAIIGAESMDAAQKLASTCTVADSVLVYEALPM